MSEQQKTEQQATGEPGKEQQTAAAEEPKFVFGDSERAATREIHRSARELERLQSAVEDRKKEVEELEKRAEALRVGAAEPKKAEPDSEGLVEAYGGRLPPELVEYLESLRDLPKAIRQELASLRAEVDTLRNADVTAEREEHEEAIERGLRALTVSARKVLVPGLSEKAARRVDREVWSEFEERWSAFVEARGENKSDVTEEELQGLVADSVQAVRVDMAEMGWQQLAANRQAAERTTPTLGGTPAVSGAKEYRDMTPEEREKAKTEARITEGHVEFTSD